MFFNLLCDAMDQVPMRILGVCLMPNHFHLVLWPIKGIDLSAYMRWLMNAHVRRYHQHYETTGLGHIWQGRYKNFLVQSDTHLYNVLRYVEGNAARANLVQTAESWRWSSVNRRHTPDGRKVPRGVASATPGRLDGVRQHGETPEELKTLRNSVKRGAPYGDQWWVQDTVRVYGLESTIHPQGQRKKLEPAMRAGFE